MANLTYQQEFIVSVRDYIEPLLEADWQEIEHNKGIRPLDPDWDMYADLEANDALRIYTVRDGRKLVGYFVVGLVPDLHSKGNRQAAADVIYLHPDYRKGLVGYKLFKFAEDNLRQEGFRSLLVTTTEVNPIDPIISRLGYNKVETKYEKVL